MNRYISDLHFGHTNILKFDNRPFSNTEEMEASLMEKSQKSALRVLLIQVPAQSAEKQTEVALINQENTTAVNCVI